MKESKVAKDVGDTLSYFPDEIQIYILSFLPARDIVRTSILSSRWKHMYTCVPNIEPVIKEIRVLRETRETMTSLGVKMEELAVGVREMQEASNALVKSEKIRLVREILETLASIRVKLSESPVDLEIMLENMDAVVKSGEALSETEEAVLRGM